MSKTIGPIPFERLSPIEEDNGQSVDPPSIMDAVMWSGRLYVVTRVNSRERQVGLRGWVFGVTKNAAGVTIDDSGFVDHPEDA